VLFLKPPSDVKRVVVFGAWFNDAQKHISTSARLDAIDHSMRTDLGNDSLDESDESGRVYANGAEDLATIKLMSIQYGMQNPVSK
jgi:hypothetical protein